MGRCTGRHDITEILLKKGVKHRTINQLNLAHVMWLVFESVAKQKLEMLVMSISTFSQNAFLKVFSHKNQLALF